MEGLVMIAAAGAVVLILVWLFGSGLARVAGIVLVIDGLGGLVIHAGSFDNPRYAIEAAAGIGLWMFGHWLFALKHGMWRTRLGRAAWRVPVGLGLTGAQLTHPRAPAVTDAGSARV